MRRPLESLSAVAATGTLNPRPADWAGRAGYLPPLLVLPGRTGRGMPPTAGAPYYLMMLMRSPRRESLAVITRAFAWNDRCVLIRSMNSCAICTFDCSSAEDTIVPLPCEPAVAIASGPESIDAR